MSKHIRPVDQYTLEGKYIKTFQRMIDAASETGATKGNIWGCCNGDCNQVKGFRYAYKGYELPEWHSTKKSRYEDGVQRVSPSGNKGNCLLVSKYFGYFA